jgi:putrescine transport system substrate-binding protein
MMFKKLAISMCIILLGLTTSMVTPTFAEEEKTLNVYFWFDYLLDSTVKGFEKETGIKVNLDTFENLSMLETKLLTGKSGYDIVIPTSSMIGRLIKLDSFKKLDKSRFSNYGNLDPEILSNLAKIDKNNAYGILYAWGTTGIAFNIAKVKKHLPNVDLKSWDLLFKPENISKLADCGVAFRDAYDELIPIALNYLGLDYYSVKNADLKKAENLLMSLRPYIRHFNNGAIIEELATGELCAAITYNGDGGIASARADELKNGIVLDYSIPKEGTIIYFDLLSIPADADHPKNAHKFLNFIMRPNEAATFSNEFFFANANATATELVLDEIKGDPDIYPSDKTMKTLFPQATLPKKERRKYTRLWTKIKAAK